MHTLSQSHTSVQHDVFRASHLILGFLRPSSRAPAVERIEPARCVLQARRQAFEASEVETLRRELEKVRFRERQLQTEVERSKELDGDNARAGVLDLFVPLFLSF